MQTHAVLPACTGTHADTCEQMRTSMRASTLARAGMVVDSLIVRMTRVHTHAHAHARTSCDNKHMHAWHTRTRAHAEAHG
eukprot:2719800-Alexandrium_andersonii.AAC.1